MPPITELTIVAGLCAAGAAAYYPLLVPRAGARRAAALGLGAVLLPTPLVVSDAHPASATARFLAAILVALTVWKIYDLHVGFRRHGRPAPGVYARFMLPGIHHAVFRRIGTEPGPDDASNRRHLALGLLELALGGIGLGLTFGVLDLGRPRTEVGPGFGFEVGFWLEHVAKWTALYVVFDGGLRILVAGARLFGRDAVEVFRDPILARTPADFWRRYNRMVGEWLYVNVYRRRVFRGHPVGATLAAFTASALLHEYVFGMALLRVQGYQAAFFLLHGVATAATARLRPQGGWAVVGWALTLVFTLATLVLFTASLDQVIAPLLPFYAHDRPPLWAD